MKLRWLPVFAVTPVILLVVFASSSFARAASTIDVGPFTLAPPQGPGWQVIEKKSGDIAFKKEMSGPPPRLMTSQHIWVTRETPDRKKWNLSEEQIANGYRSQEEQGMTILGTLKGKYQVQNVKKGIIRRVHKKLYFMSYQTVQHSPHGEVGTEIVTDTVLYLYFPPQFTRNHFVYMFHAADACLVDEPGSCGKFDTSFVLPVVASLHIK